MKTTVPVAAGTLVVLSAVVLAVASPGSGTTSPVVLVLGVTVATFGLLGALLQVAGSGTDDEGLAPAPWSDEGALTTDPPEHSAATADLSGDRLAAVVERAGNHARDDGTVAAGIEVVRPPLREALVDALVRGGTSREAASESLATGCWTDDRRAAAVLDDSVDGPARSLRERVEAWLFPERVVRRETRRAMGAVADAADESLPTVPGQYAQRTVPVLRPTLETLRRGADGAVQEAVDPYHHRPGAGSHARRRATTDPERREKEEAEEP